MIVVVECKDVEDGGGRREGGMRGQRFGWLARDSGELTIGPCRHLAPVSSCFRSTSGSLLAAHDGRRTGRRLEDEDDGYSLPVGSSVHLGPGVPAYQGCVKLSDCVSVHVCCPFYLRMFLVISTVAV